jgi:arylsulfatase A-like enzyme
VGGFGKMRYLRTADWKLVAYVDDRYELYDLNNDPHELENLYNRTGLEAIKQHLRHLLLEQMMRVASPGISTDYLS